jgi:hypothetical protein
MSDRISDAADYQLRVRPVHIARPERLRPSREANRSTHSRSAYRPHTKAAARYNELMVRHPAAFADHAAKFWLSLRLPREHLSARQ